VYVNCNVVVRSFTSDIRQSDELRVPYMPSRRSLVENRIVDPSRYEISFLNTRPLQSEVGVAISGAAGDMTGAMSLGVPRIA
jgi:hypothetical protein